MNRKRFIRSFVLGTILAVVAAIAPGAAFAQGPALCQNCDHVLVVNNTACTVTVCFLGEVIIHCHDFAPGTTTSVPCAGFFSVDIRDCAGNLHPITPDCVNVAVNGPCCVRACLERNATGCAVVRLGPSPIDCICP